jgi:hypothetical protein
MSYISPKFNQEAFNCPHCNAYAHQIWLFTIWGRLQGRPTTAETRFLSDEYAASECERCKEVALWRNEEMIYPNTTTAPLPEEDMPDEIKEDFNEARQVFSISPRSSAALLRLVIQKLCKHLGYPGKDINSDIGKMVANGFDPLIQQAFDAVRVIGNEAVHPGQIDLRDDKDTTLQLFNLVNFIVEELITKPRRVQEIYNRLPQGKLQQIEERDKGSRPTTNS